MILETFAQLGVFIHNYTSKVHGGIEA